MAGYGLPYQGSKGSYAPMIFRAIEQRRKAGAPRVLVDPFCGGFAVSHCFGEAGWETVSSDIDRYVIALINRSVTGIPEDEAYQWVSREQFLQARDEPESLGWPDWRVGFVRLVWSFGNSQTSYIYGAAIEEGKRLVHDLVVSARPSKLLEDVTGVPLRVQEKVGALSSVYSRRLAWGRAYARIGDDETPTYAVQTSIERVERVLNLGSLQAGVAGDRVLSFRGSRSTVRDYREALMEAPRGAVIYMDPPYADTKGYPHSGEGFDHEEFWALASEASKGHQVYVSEYTAPEGWESILSFSRPQTMTAYTDTAKQGKAREHLFKKAI